MSAAAQHIRSATEILDQPAEDLGSDELAEATGLALLAIAEHLGDIVRLMDARVNGA